MRIAAVIAASPTLRALTKPHTLIAADVHTTFLAADVRGTFWAADLGTIRSLDLIGTSLAGDIVDTRKGFDDVKAPALDKAFGDTKPPMSDNPVFDPGVFGRPFQPPLARPFVLATPHQTMAWGRRRSA